MSVTFIIGNGFDLNCGLKSTYKDVYGFYCHERPEDKDVIKKFKKDIESDIENWSDFENMMAGYAKNFDKEEDFISCVDDFVKFLRFYLNDQEESFVFNIEETLKENKIILHEELRKSISDFYKGFTNNVENEIYKEYLAKPVNIITFNYTNTLEYINSIVNSNLVNKIIHIHGSLTGSDTLVGVDNENQLKNLKFDLTDYGKRHFIKPFFNQAFDRQRVEEAKTTISFSKYICVYGASLGDSDLMWKNEIKEWLLNDESRILFIYDYRYIYLKDELAQTKLDKEEKIRDEYMKILNISSDNINAKNRIVIMVGKNIFNFMDLINNYIEHNDNNSFSIDNL